MDGALLHVLGGGLVKFAFLDDPAVGVRCLVDGANVAGWKLVHQASDAAAAGAVSDHE